MKGEEAMHRYLRAIGFSKIIRNREVRELLNEVRRDPTAVLSLGDGVEHFEFIDRSFGDGIGIRLFGDIDEESRWREQYYFPYVESGVISTTKYCSVERHSDQMSFGGIIDDPAMGISLIFYLSNGVEYVNEQRKRRERLPVRGISLNGLCVSGKILLPVYKTDQEREKLKIAAKNRVALLEAAKNGDENAIESLAIEDMNLFQKVSQRISREDLYTIVDTCFMPYGLESDQYAVVGEIQSVEKVKNRISGEECWRLTMECNDVLLTVTMNEQDLLGEPAVGRRFKGDIWLQGTILF